MNIAAAAEAQKLMLIVKNTMMMIIEMSGLDHNIDLIDNIRFFRLSIVIANTKDIFLLMLFQNVYEKWSIYNSLNSSPLP